jgi:hypothetical protein
VVVLRDGRIASDETKAQFVARIGAGQHAH